MQTTLKNLTRADYERFLRFINRAFARGDTQSDFVGRIPKLYRPENVRMEHQLALYEGEEMVAVAGAFPFDYHVGGAVLHGAMIGNVATDPDKRGRGHMTALMEGLMARLSEMPYDLLLLGGMRERYRRYGFEMSGAYRYMCFERDNLRHLAEADRARFVLAPFDAAPQAEKDRSAALWARQAQRVKRPRAVFEDTLKTWYARTHMLYDADGAWQGYLAGAEDLRDIWELQMEHPERMPQALLSLALDHGVPLCRLLLPEDRALHALLWPYCSDVRTETQAHFQVLRWDRVVKALLRHKHRESPLLHGALTIALGGQALSVRVGPDGVTACPCEDTPAFAVPLETAHAFAFGPHAARFPRADGALRPLLADWFPLPVHISILDRG